ncbi:tetraacyldisaccharide 4'-kinase [Hippea sp. KM1]|uniref:tetraacyldisaccharide 4'-kinase n=1 Tax=Hippea sp. KM1 TaxID=944481 RepID=UPI00046D5E5E|nr:tetraacyldisaccharide 4'-kinase [Hippea sp. KM1]
MNQVKAKKLQAKLKPLLVPFSFLYGAIANAIEGYSSRKPKRVFSSLKVISIGNLVAGGVGKTPLSIKLANALSNYGKVCVITNNYPLKDKGVHLVSIEGNIFKKPPKVSDEPYMVALKCPFATVIASRDRIAAIELAAGFNIDFVILDDALHINNIKKDIEICVFDKDKPFGDGYYLPAGLIRTAKRAIERCNIKVCIDRNDTDKEPPFECIQAKLRINGIFDKDLKPAKIDDKTAFAFCGIGNPEGFLHTIEKLNIKLKGYEFFDDHHQYTPQDIELIRNKQKDSDADILITTLKDMVKLRNLENLYYIDIDLQLDIEKIVREVIDG